MLSFLDKVFLFAVLFFIGWIVHTEVQKAQVNAEAQREFRNQQFETVKETLALFHGHIKARVEFGFLLDQITYALEEDEPQVILGLKADLEKVSKDSATVHDGLIAHETNMVMYLGRPQADRYANFLTEIVGKDADMRQKVRFRIRKLAVDIAKNGDIGPKQKIEGLGALRKFRETMRVSREERQKL